MSAPEHTIEHILPSRRMSPEALGVVSRLQRAGYEAYFVGGCVRDLLIDRIPKDFDIATDARPQDVKSLFGPACRLIGRRFRLAHVRVAQSLLEVATFRGRPDSQEVSEDDSGFVVRANTFGSPEDDAHSRDFTVNGLFYDPIRHVIFDYVGGMQDVRERRLRAIGPADERLREDPVRILRGIRLGTRLGLDFTADLREAAAEHASLIRNCSKSRVIEELFRIFETGYASPSVRLMFELDLLRWILPELHAHAEKDVELYLSWLAELDRLTRAHGPLPRSTIFCLVCWPVAFDAILNRGASERWDWGRALETCIAEVAGQYAVPVRYRERLRSILNIIGGQWNDPALPVRKVRSPALPLALAVLRMQFRLGIGDGRGYEDLAGRCRELGLPEAPFEVQAPESRGGRTRNRGGGRRPRQGKRRRQTETQI